MPIIETRGSLSSRGYGQFAQGGAAPVAGAFIEDVFSTTLYGGTGAAQSIANGIALGTGATSAGWFANTFGSASTSETGVAVDSTGNAYVCGNTVISALNVGKLAKFSPTGALLWQTSLPATSVASIFLDVALGPSGDVYVCGYTVVTGNNACLIAKYNSSGALQWQRILSAAASNYIAYAITVDSSDFVYVTGDGAGASNIFTVKLDSSGTIQWQRRASYGSGILHEGSDIAVDASGNVHVVGRFAYVPVEDQIDQGIILKYNSSGTLLWQKSQGTITQQVRARSCSLDAAGNIYVFSINVSSSFVIISKYAPSGTDVWQRSYSGSIGNFTGSLQTTASGDTYLCVHNNGSPNNGFVAKFDTNGTLQWQRRLQTTSVPCNLYRISLSGSESLWVVGELGTSPSPGLVARLPLDGSGTGAYSLNGTSLPYVTASEASGSTSTSSGLTVSDIAGLLTSSTPTFTNTPTFLATALTPLAQGAGRGGLVWIKGRSTTSDHALYDTTRGATADLVSNSTAAQTTQAQGLTAFLGSGFSIGTLSKLNTSAAIYAAWTFAEQSKFFDVVTYTGTGVNRTVTHNLGSVPGCIIVKSLGTGDWQVYHRSLANTQYLVLNTTAAAATGATRWNSTTPTATEFSLGTDTSVNGLGNNYVAYLFAHDAGGFGASGTDNVISCGSFTADGSGNATVTLGYEPQFVLLKRVGVSDWHFYDNMRGLPVSASQPILRPNLSNPDSNVTQVSLTATGFTQANFTGAGQAAIYIAIRRGPMRTPTLGTNVFMPTVYTGTNVNNRLVNTSIAPDMVWMRQRNDNVLGGVVVGDRLRGQPYLLTGETNAELTSATAFDQQLVSAAEYGNAFSSMNGVWVGTDATAKLNVDTTANNHIVEAFKRAPGFFNSVCYTGTASSLVVTHGLGVTPELIISKNRTGTSETAWYVGSTYLPNGFGGTGHNLQLNSLAASAQNGYFTSVNSTTATFANPVARDGQTYIAHFFASCPGVSKVGSYTGTGSTLQVNCGFTSGARFVLIKRMNASGAWFFWDSARGIVSGNDPYLRANSTGAEVTGTDWVDTLATGFEVSNAAGNDANVNGGTYLFLAIA